MLRVARARDVRPPARAQLRLAARWAPLLAFAGGQIVATLAMLAVLLGSPVVSDYASRTAFDSAAWKAENHPGAAGVRVHMVDDLLHRHPLRGMSRAQLEELLGVPSPTGYFQEYDYVYWLGAERGFISIDSEWLVVKCERGVVVDARIVTD